MKFGTAMPFYFLVLLMMPSCDKSTTKNDVVLDSLETDLIRCYFLAYYQTRDGYGYDLVDDKVAPGSDSVNLRERLNQVIVLGASRESMTPEVEVSGDFLVVDYCDSTMCKLSVIDRGEVVREGWLPRKVTAQLINPSLEFRMSTFYRLQEDLIERYSKDFQDKYNLPEELVDSLVQVTADKLSRRGRVIRNDWF
jgi:hypothetical protein